MKKEKKVTNLLENVGKVRDILATGDMKKLKWNKYFIEKTKDDLIRHVVKYIADENHQCDFNHEDVRAISDEIFDILDSNIKMRYSNIHKTLIKKAPFTLDDYYAVCERMGDTNYLDAFFRPIANDLSNFAIAMWIWSESDYRKPFEQQILEHLRSFL